MHATCQQSQAHALLQARAGTQQFRPADLEGVLQQAAVQQHQRAVQHEACKVTAVQQLVTQRCCCAGCRCCWGRVVEPFKGAGPRAADHGQLIQQSRMLTLLRPRAGVVEPHGWLQRKRRIVDRPPLVGQLQLAGLYNGSQPNKRPKQQLSIPALLTVVQHLLCPAAPLHGNPLPATAAADSGPALPRHKGNGLPARAPTAPAASR